MTGPASAEAVQIGDDGRVVLPVYKDESNEPKPYNEPLAVVSGSVTLTVLEH